MRNGIRSTIWTSMAVVLAISVPKEAHPQVGAFGAAAALGAQGESAHAGSPVFTEHGRVLDRGRTSGSSPPARPEPGQLRARGMSARSSPAR